MNINDDGESEAALKENAEKVAKEACIYADNEVYIKKDVPEEADSDGKNEYFHAVEIGETYTSDELRAADE